MFKLMNFRIKERDEFELYLNQMASNGYRLKWFNEYVLCFDECVDSLHYYVDYNPDFKLNAHRYIDEDLQRKIDFYATMGLDLVTVYDRFVVFSSSKFIDEFHSDDSLEEQIIEKVKARHKFLRLWVSAFLLLVIFIVYWPGILAMLYEVKYLIALCVVVGAIALERYIVKNLGLSDKCNLEYNLKKIRKRTLLYLFSYVFCYSLLLGIVGFLFSNFKIVLLYGLLFIIMFIFRYFLTNTLSINDYGGKKIILIILVLIGFFVAYVNVYDKILESMLR